MKAVEFPNFRIFYGGVLLPNTAHFLASAYALLSANSKERKHDEFYEWLFKFTVCCGRTRTSDVGVADEVIVEFLNLLNAYEAEIISKWSSEYSPAAAEWLLASTRDCIQRMRWATPNAGTISWEGIEI